MIILAKTMPGKEFLYSVQSAHKVSEASAKKILQVVNDFRFTLEENETWHIYHIDEYDPAFTIAQRQAFIIRKGIVKACYK